MNFEKKLAKIELRYTKKIAKLERKAAKLEKKAAKKAARNDDPVDIIDLYDKVVDLADR